MARPYTLDLRTRIIKVYQEGKFSIRQILILDTSLQPFIYKLCNADQVY